MSEMITVRCPRCGKKLQFSPFENYKKATLECPSCHYTDLVETYPVISYGQANSNNHTNYSGQQSNGQQSSGQQSSGQQSNGQQSNGQRHQYPTGIRGLDTPTSTGSARTSRTQAGAGSQPNQQPTGFALKFPWVIAGLALAIIILYVFLQCISTNEVI